METSFLAPLAIVALLMVTLVALIALIVMARALSSSHERLMGVVVDLSGRRQMNSLLEENKDSETARTIRRIASEDRAGPPASTNARTPRYRPAPDDAVPNGQPVTSADA